MIYTGEHLKELIFPLGGIGCGCIGLAGNGRLVDFEIFNRPNKGSINGYTHFAVRAVSSDGRVDARVLNGDLVKDLVGQYQKMCYRGYGYCPAPQTMCGFRHFRECSFKGEFPIAEITFSDPTFPAVVTLTAFNPFIPLCSDDSSIPAAFFSVTVKNVSEQAMRFDTALSFGNPFEKSENTVGERNGIRYIHMKNTGVGKDDPAYGDLTLVCSDPSAELQRYWYRGSWQDGIVTYWNALTSGAPFSPRDYTDSGSCDMCTACSGAEIAPGESRSVRFVVSWSVPNCYNYWNPQKDENGKDILWKNYYATLYPSSVESALYSITDFDRLYDATNRFREALFASTLDPAVLDAAASNLAILHSSTVLRLEGGEFWAWEGTHEKEGSCEGICQHVWNYAYALCFLFPDLERSIRDIELKYSLQESGLMPFRLGLPLGHQVARAFRPCVDGQMGTIIKIYRDWKITGNDIWLREHFAQIIRMLDFAWSAENPFGWDMDKDGVMEGRQHHTLDDELFGPSSWLQGFYLAALLAASEMADYLGYSEKAKEYREIYENGRKKTNTELFNGEYFAQKVDLGDKSILDRFGCAEHYWNDEAKQIKYQIDNGCEIDQLCGQWHANISSLGRIFDKDKTDIALEHLYKYNFRRSMRDFDNPWRIYALNDDPGAIICTYPHGNQPAIPIPYCQESMNGFEYQLAGLLISEGHVEKGLEIVRGIRSKYNGANRNPFSEMECGSNYARSMASFALLPIMSGFLFDMPHKRIGFMPICHEESFRCIWSLESAWGNIEISKDGAVLSILGGALTIGTLELKFLSSVSRLLIDGKSVDFSWKNGTLRFEEHRICSCLQVKS